MKYTVLVVVGVLTALAGGVTVGANILNKREKKIPEYVSSDMKRTLGKEATFYEKYIKRGIDVLVSFIGIILSAPIVLVSSVFIYWEDPGNVIFKQKRIGTNKSYFNIHKLRSMRQNTGDIPTHLLSQEKQDNLILKVGRFIRKTSVDELPQFIDIYRGRMSLIGPRPALWNQEDLIRERDKYGANGVRPGLTGWAQINGRDSISIEVKAALDGEYVEALRRSGFSGFKMDCKCFWRTIKSVFTSDGVVEGGTGTLNAEDNMTRSGYPDKRKHKRKW